MTWPTRRKAALLLALVFVSGGAAGWLLEEVVDDLDWPAASSTDRPHERSGESGFDEDEEEDFLRTLGLTPTQRDSVDHLLDQGEDRLEAYWAGKLPEIERLLDSTRLAIKALLTPEQRQAYERWLAGQRDATTQR